MDCADERADEISEVWGHNRPNGESYVTIIDYSIVSYRNIYENIAGGCATAEETMNQFRNSSSHWQTIMNPDITHMGIGLCYNPDGYGGAVWYWCQIFSCDVRKADYKYQGQYLPEDSEKTEEPEIMGAFENASKLVKIVIPESVKKIGNKSFSITSLTTVKIASDCEYSESSFPENCEIKFYE